MLKRFPSLTEQVKSQLKRSILNQEFEDGRIPSETDLAQELGVSRTTIRDALSRLELEGAIFRKQGAGTFVNEASLQIKTRLEEIWYYADMLEAHGYTPSTQLLEVAARPLASSPEAALVAGLDLTRHSKIVVVKKLFLADQRPIILTHNIIPAHLITEPYQPDSFYPPIYRFLAEVCHQHLAYYLSEIVPVTPEPWLRESLRLPPDRTALISFEEIAYNHDNVPIIKAFSYFRDDLLRLRLIRRDSI